MNEFEKLVLKVASKATKEVQEKNHKNGIANVYSKNGQIFFQLPNGSITQDEPQQYKDIIL